MLLVGLLYWGNKNPGHLLKFEFQIFLKIFFSVSMSHGILGIHLITLDSKDGGEIDLYVKPQTLRLQKPKY